MAISSMGSFQPALKAHTGTHGDTHTYHTQTAHPSYIHHTPGRAHRHMHAHVCTPASKTPSTCSHHIVGERRGLNPGLQVETEAAQSCRLPAGGTLALCPPSPPARCLCHWSGPQCHQHRDPRDRPVPEGLSRCGGRRSGEGLAPGSERRRGPGRGVSGSEPETWFRSSPAVWLRAGVLTSLSPAAHL